MGLFATAFGVAADRKNGALKCAIKARKTSTYGMETANNNSSKQKTMRGASPPGLLFTMPLQAFHENSFTRENKDPQKKNFTIYLDLLGLRPPAIPDIQTMTQNTPPPMKQAAAPVD